MYYYIEVYSERIALYCAFRRITKGKPLILC